MPMTVFESLLIMLTFGALVLYLNNRWKCFLIKYKSILYVNNRMKRFSFKYKSILYLNNRWKYFLIKYKSHLQHIFPLNIIMLDIVKWHGFSFRCLSLDGKMFRRFI